MPETMPATVGGPTLRRVWMCGLGACWKLTAMASPRGSAAGIGGTGWPDSTRRASEPRREADAILGLALPPVSRTEARMADRSAASELAERAMRSVLLTLSHRKSIGRLATQLPVTRPMVGRFVAGETMEEALPAIERLHEQGMATTVDVLGESVTAEADARAACASYVAVARCAGRPAASTAT